MTMKSPQSVAGRSALPHDKEAGRTPLSLQIPQKPQDTPFQPIFRSPGQIAGDETDMAAMGAELQGDAGSQFLFEGNAGGKHEGIVQGVDDQGRRGDGRQVATTTGPVVIIEDAGEATEGSGDALVEGIEIPNRADVDPDGAGLGGELAEEGLLESAHQMTPVQAGDTLIQPQHGIAQDKRG
jgi:hypothetical protein